MSKRKNSFRDEFKKEFENIMGSLKDVHFAHCYVCDCEINMEVIGKAAIFAFNDTQQHKKCARMINSNQFVETSWIFLQIFLQRPSQPTTTDYKAAAAEGILAYHTVKHQQTFNSNHCTSQFFKAIFPDSDVAKKFTSAKTRISSIIIGVLAPLLNKRCCLTLVHHPFQSRLMPLITRKWNYFLRLSSSSVLKLELVYFFSICIQYQVRLETDHELQYFICGREWPGLAATDIILCW